MPMEVSQLMVNILYRSYIKMNNLRKTVYVGNPKPKKETYFCFVCVFEYINVIP